MPGGMTPEEEELCVKQKCRKTIYHNRYCVKQERRKTIYHNRYCVLNRSLGKLYITKGIVC